MYMPESLNNKNFSVVIHPDGERYDVTGKKLE